MGKATVKGCGFMAGNGNIIAVVEASLPPISSGYYQLRANPYNFEIHAAGEAVARFPMPHPTVFEMLTHVSQIGVVECTDGVWPDIITNSMYVQTFAGDAL